MNVTEYLHVDPPQNIVIAYFTLVAGSAWFAGSRISVLSGVTVAVAGWLLPRLYPYYPVTHCPHFGAAGWESCTGCTISTTQVYWGDRSDYLEPGEELPSMKAARQIAEENDAALFGVNADGVEPMNEQAKEEQD